MQRSGWSRAQGGERGVSGVEAEDFVAFGFEQEGEELTAEFVVFNDEDEGGLQLWRRRHGHKGIKGVGRAGDFGVLRSAGGVELRAMGLGEVVMRRGIAGLLLAAPLLAQTAGPAVEVRHLRYERAVQVAASGAGHGDAEACAVLDAAVYAHAAASLKDVRVFRGQAEVPYAITVSEAAAESDAARVLNLAERGGKIVFDLEMPARAYSSVVLDLEGKDFIAAASVSGERKVGGPRTLVTSGTVFDLSSQHLSRSMTIPLGEVTFPVLHVELTARPAPGAARGAPAVVVRGASVPPSREAQTVYTTVAETSVVQRGRETVATFHVPMRVPVERVSFALPVEYGKSFSREVRVTARPDGGSAAQAETVMGEVSSVKVAGAAVQSLHVPATVGANLQSGATVEVAVENGEDAPVPFTTVRLEMRQRKICFEGAGATLFYGDAALHAPMYDFARLFSGGAARPAALGAEMENVAWVARKDERAYTERHPELLWVVLLGVVCVLGLVALRSARVD